MLHSLTAYLFLLVGVVNIISAIFHLTIKKYDWTKIDTLLYRLFFVLSHIMLLLGLVQWMTGGHLSNLINNTKMVMKEPMMRLLSLEHPLINIIGVIIISIGYFKIKGISNPHTKKKNILIYYGIALVLFISRIPWNQWI
ncbi:MAG: hypothetical protein MUE53_01135 [Chitinophagales bacterium]|nr:hypothetical protein [Chitinophagales bacterium]